MGGRGGGLKWHECCFCVVFLHGVWTTLTTKKCSCTLKQELRNQTSAKHHERYSCRFEAPDRRKFLTFENYSLLFTILTGYASSKWIEIGVSDCWQTKFIQNFDNFDRLCIVEICLKWGFQNELSNCWHSKIVQNYS